MKKTRIIMSTAALSILTISLVNAANTQTMQGISTQNQQMQESNTQQGSGTQLQQTQRTSTQTQQTQRTNTQTQQMQGNGSQKGSGTQIQIQQRTQAEIQLQQQEMTQRMEQRQEKIETKYSKKVAVMVKEVEKKLIAAQERTTKEVLLKAYPLFINKLKTLMLQIRTQTQLQETTRTEYMNFISALSETIQEELTILQQ